MTDQLDDVRRLLKESQSEDAPREVIIEGISFAINPLVFSPAYFDDTAFFARNFPSIKGEDVLEIGPGIGVISVLAAMRGAKSVVAVDINPYAVRNTLENVSRLGVEKTVTVLEGDLFNPIKSARRFGTIFWNVPFGYTEGKEDPSIIERAIVDPKYRSLHSFISSAPRYLKEDGRLLIGFSPTIGRADILKSIVEENDFSIATLAEHSVGTPPIIFHLYEMRRQ